MSKLSLSLQLYTVRDLLAADFAGTMKQVARIGYKSVEMAGFGNLKNATEAKKALDDAGLKAIGTHAGVDLLGKDLGKALDDCRILGVKNLICPWIGEDLRNSAAAWKNTAKILNQAGKQVHAAGLEFAYHNHNFEFQSFEGQTGLDILWQNTEPELVKSELDVFWVKFAGEDPVAYMKKLGKRILLVHLKDMSAGPDRKFAPVGTGILDFKAICDQAEKVGVQYGIVEQDNCYDTPPLDAIKTSYENLQKLGLK